MSPWMSGNMWGYVRYILRATKKSRRKSSFRCCSKRSASSNVMPPDARSCEVRSLTNMHTQCSVSSPARAAKEAMASVPVSVPTGEVIGFGVTGCISDCRASCNSVKPPAVSWLSVAELRTSRSMFSIFQEAVLASSANRFSVPRRALIETDSSVARDRASESVRINCSKSASGMYKSEV